MRLARIALVLLIAAAAPFLASARGTAAVADWRGREVESPNGAVKVAVSVRGGRLLYSVSLGGSAVIEPSPAAITLDGVNLGEGVEPGKVRSYNRNDSYPERGVHATAAGQCRGITIALLQVQSGTHYEFEARACDDAVAFRTRVPGSGNATRIPGEATAFTLPLGSTVWYHGMRGHYEGRHVRKPIGEVEAGEWAAPPVTFKLPGNAGYASITEAALVQYSGMALQAAGENTFRARLGHEQPPSYPFTLRYGDAEAKRLSAPAAIAGDIVTPWRVVLVGHDLNTLVNSDVLANLSAAPDRKLFPEGARTPWVCPGRAVWKYLDDPRPGTVEIFREYSDWAHELGFEYSVVEGVWQRWPEPELKDFIAYSKKLGVGIFLWKHSKELRDPVAQQAFFQKCRAVGAAGVKIDFFDHEAKEVVDLYPVLLREAAEAGLLVNFHGANKPAGESRTWPNQLTREAVAGMESRGPRAVHDATLPFTRFLAGPADYTPVVFGDRRGDTTWAHQIATAVVFTSPLLTYAANPKTILGNPAVATIKAIPSTWDETVVVPPSAIGEQAVFARRSGQTWFLAVINGASEHDLKVSLSFLAAGEYGAQLVRDGGKDDAVEIENTKVNRTGTVSIHLRSGGGFVGWFRE